MKKLHLVPCARELVLACGLLSHVAAFAQHSDHPEQLGQADQQQSGAQGAASAEQQGSAHQGMRHAPSPSTARPNDEQQGQGQQMGTDQPMPAMNMGAGQEMQAGSMQGMQMGPMQGGKPPPDARDPNAYGEGTRHANLPGSAMNDEARFGRLLVNSVEVASGDGEHGQNLDAEAWYGGDFDKVWLKAEGERRDGRLETLRTEALWGHAFAPFWSTQLGVRHDTGSGDARNWLAFGVQGLAPYWFETEVTAYVRSGGHFGARADVRYELLFTQRLILEPQLQANVYSRADPEHGTGSGLSDLGLGLRLRYEVRRQFAPYIGVTWQRKFGDAARFAEQGGGRRQRLQAVAGVRLWF